MMKKKTVNKIKAKKAKSFQLIMKFDDKPKKVISKKSHKMKKNRNMNKAPLLKRIEASITPGLKKMAKRNGGIALKIVSKRTGIVKNRKLDSKIRALPPGYRLSRTGKVYYEGRKNRSDAARKRI